MEMRALILAGSLLLPAFAQMPSGLKTAIDRTCFGCHSGTAAKGGLDFAALSFDLSNRATRERWVRVHDRIEKGEMPPKGVELAAADRTAMLRQLAPLLHKADLTDVAKNGRGPIWHMSCVVDESVGETGLKSPTRRRGAGRYRPGDSDEAPLAADQGCITVAAYGAT